MKGIGEQLGAIGTTIGNYAAKPVEVATEILNWTGRQIDKLPGGTKVTNFVRPILGHPAFQGAVLVGLTVWVSKKLEEADWKIIPLMPDFVNNNKGTILDVAKIGTGMLFMAAVL